MYSVRIEENISYSYYVYDNVIYFQNNQDFIRIKDGKREVIKSYEAVSYTHLTLPTICSV